MERKNFLKNVKLHKVCVEDDIRPCWAYIHFEDWIGFWYNDLKVYQSGQSVYGKYRAPSLQMWLECHYPKAPPEVKQAVADCFDNKPDAYASWTVGKGNELNVIIHPSNKHQKSLNNE